MEDENNLDIVKDADEPETSETENGGNDVGLAAPGGEVIIIK